MVLKYISNGLRQARRFIGYTSPAILALALACSRGESTPHKYTETPSPEVHATAATIADSSEYFLRKYTVIPDERRLKIYMSKKNIRQAVETHMKKVVVIDLDGNKESVDVGLFADNLSNASFNFLSIKGLEATFYHPESGECTERMERFDFDPPLSVQNFSPPHEPIGTSFLSTIKCEIEWKGTQTQWSNAAPIESFFTWVNGTRSWHDLIFDNRGRQFILKKDGDIQSGYYIDPSISRND